MKRQLKYLWILFYFILYTNLTFAQSDEKSEITFIKAGKLFDSENGKILTDYIIKIENNQINEVGKNISVPENAKIIDLTEYTVLPGLIDGHTHLMTLDDLKDKHPMADKLLFEGDALRVLRGSKRARSWLESGFTTIRDLGDSGYFLDVALKRAIKAGVTILTGSDNYLNFEMPQGEAAKNVLIAYEEEGMKPLEILKSSTYLSAKFMDKENELGIIKEGAFADIIAVKGDIINDFSNTIFDIVFVMKNGKIYVEK